MPVKTCSRTEIAPRQPDFVANLLMRAERGRRRSSSALNAAAAPGGAAASPHTPAGPEGLGWARVRAR